MNPRMWPDIFILFMMLNSPLRWEPQASQIPSLIWYLNESSNFWALTSSCACAWSRQLHSSWAHWDWWYTSLFGFWNLQPSGSPLATKISILEIASSDVGHISRARTYSLLLSFMMMMKSRPFSLFPENRWAPRSIRPVSWRLQPAFLISSISPIVTWASQP